MMVHSSTKRRKPRVDGNGLCQGTWAVLNKPKIVRREWDKTLVICPECGSEVPWTDLFGVAGHKPPGSHGAYLYQSRTRQTSPDYSLGMNVNPCLQCGHLRKEHVWFKGDWSCNVCHREYNSGARSDDEYCIVYTPTRLGRDKDGYS